MITGSWIICYEGCPLNGEKVTLVGMCLITIAYQQHNQVPLIVASNRDEFYARPTIPMHWWHDAPILAGRDQQAKGTWLGLSRNGRFAAVTNYRQGANSRAQSTALLSRGSLVKDFLCSTQSSHQWSQTMLRSGADFDGFNLLIYDGTELVYCNNHNPQPPQVLSSGVYALSNGALNSPWPKVDHARDQLRQLLDRSEQSTPQLPELISLLSSQQTYAAELLPNTGIPPEWEQRLSAPFIVAEDYGTRASTAVLVAASGDIAVAEQNFQAGEMRDVHTFNFNASER